MSQYQLTAATLNTVHAAILDALDAGDVGVGGYPTTAAVHDRTDLSEGVIRKATRELERQDRIEISVTLTEVDQCGSHANTYIPLEVER